MLQFVTIPLPHKHDVRGDEEMKEFIIDGTKIVIHSDLVLMTEEEKKQWFEDEKAKGNPVLKEITRAMIDCYQ